MNRDGYSDFGELSRAAQREQRLEALLRDASPAIIETPQISSAKAWEQVRGHIDRPRNPIHGWINQLRWFTAPALATACAAAILFLSIQSRGIEVPRREFSAVREAAPTATAKSVVARVGPRPELGPKGNSRYGKAIRRPDRVSIAFGGSSRSLGRAKLALSLSNGLPLSHEITTTAPLLSRLGYASPSPVGAQTESIARTNGIHSPAPLYVRTVTYGSGYIREVLEENGQQTVITRAVRVSTPPVYVFGSASTLVGAESFPRPQRGEQIAEGIPLLQDVPMPSLLEQATVIQSEDSLTEGTTIHSDSAPQPPLGG